MKAYVRGYNGSRGFGSKFIRWFNFSEFSHTSFVFRKNSHKSQDTEVESIQGSGVVCHIPNDGDFEELLIPISEEQAEKLYFSALDLVGAEYDWRGIIGFILRRNVHSPFKWTCSEFVSHRLLKLGYPLSRREPYRETPSSVMESLRLLDPVAEVGSA